MGKLLATCRGSTALTAIMVLAGTGALHAQQAGEPGAIALDTITVQGESAWGPVSGPVATRSATGSKTDAALIETPQSISVITRSQMEQQGATTVSEALRYTPGIVSGTNGLQSRRFDPVFIRGFGGFSAVATYANWLDGLQWRFGSRTSVQFDPYMIERVEVFKGPSSVLYGQAMPGGFVNLIGKRPSAMPSREVFLSAGSHGRIEGGFDITGPADPEGKLLYRVVGLGRAGETQVDFQKDQRVLIAPSFTWRPTDATSLTVTGFYQHDPHTSDAAFLPPQGTVLPSPYGRLPTSRFQGDPSYNRFSRKQAAIGYNFEHRFNDTLSFRQNLRYGHFEDAIDSVNFGSLAANGRTLNRSASRSVHNNVSFAVDNQFQVKFNTGPLRHTALFGLDYQYFDGSFRYGQAAAPTLDLWAPVYRGGIGPVATTFSRDEPFRQLGLYAQDQIELGNWRLWLSGRNDWAKTTARVTNLTNGAITANARTDDSAFTGRAGLVYLFENGLAPYVSYSTSFEPSAGSAFDGSAFEPTKGEQWEAGVKYQPPGYNSFITAAVYDLRKTNVTGIDPDASHVCPGMTLNRCQLQNGEVRSRGLEIEAKINLWESFDLIGSYSYNDIEISKSTNTVTLLNGTVVSLQGKRPVAAPEHTASVWANYGFRSGPLNGLSLGAGVRYIGETYGTDANLWNLTGFVTTPSHVPGFTLVDAAISYDFGAALPRLKGLNLTVNAKNLFDKDYVAACNGYGSCVYGEGRTVLATLRYRW